MVPCPHCFWAHDKAVHHGRDHRAKKKITLEALREREIEEDTQSPWSLPGWSLGDRKTSTSFCLWKTVPQISGYLWHKSQNMMWTERANYCGSVCLRHKFAFNFFLIKANINTQTIEYFYYWITVASWRQYLKEYSLLR